MSEQLSLMGFDATFRSTDGLVFAILPDMSAAARIAQLARHLRDELGLKGEPFALERLHISLHYLGDYEGIPPGIVAAAHEAADLADPQHQLGKPPLPTWHVRHGSGSRNAGGRRALLDSYL